ncbi:MAG: hypothetical protein GTO18_05915 [Anaerolineales bacterium]|nr:hypothetical protein [Anaerolineales bacterium]
MDTRGKFYIGRTYDLKTNKILDENTLYDPDDLTTHGVVVGMTGSGKTGLCIDILEEAALQGIPALLIDPKGDISNLLLHFPDLSPEDFQPWVDPDTARRDGKSVEQMAGETAELWKNGLADWDIGAERIEQVLGAAQYAIYTPGSDAGLPVSILASLNSPSLSWEQDREALREKISTTVTALLGLVGIESDPMRSREHILLANIFEASWREGKDLDLSELVLQVQNPPFYKLGAFEVEQFYPEEDRFELAMTLNSFLASPSFQAWTEGEPLNPEAMLWASDGTPRQSVFYLAHLPDQERMFFVTLLLSSIESWMRTQPGSPSLRAIVYFDEALGFIPPVKEPPSKAPLMRLLKQARAFGIGMLLTTQNPVDLDYKGLSNAGTWFVGRLQTERDKERLLDGLESAAGERGGFKRNEADRIISSLGKRVFLLHNVHEKAPQIFYTRWAMAYLRGPVTRGQIKDLNDLAQVEREMRPTGEIPLQPGGETEEAKAHLEGSLTQPAAPAGIQEFFLENNLTAAAALKTSGRKPSGAAHAGLIYRPALIAQASVRFLDRKIDLDVDEMVTALVEEPDRRGIIRWEQFEIEPIPIESMDDEPLPQVRFADLGAPLTDAKTMRQLEKDYVEYIYRNSELILFSNPELKLVAQSGTSESEFHAQCVEAARDARDEEIDKVQDKYLTKMKAVQKRIAREERELDEDQEEHSARKMEEMATHFENVVGLFGGSRSRRRISTSMTKRRMTSKAKADIEESVESIEVLKKEFMDLEAEMAEEIDEIEDRWEEAAEDIQEESFKPYKKNILMDAFGIAWIPFWQLSVDDESLELPATKDYVQPGA